MQFSIVSIGVFIGVLDEVVKNISTAVFKKDINKYIPIFSVVFGILLGIAGYYIPGVDMGNNIIEAIFIGLSAGAGATGVNQIGKQLTKDKVDTAAVTVEDPVTDIQPIDTTVDEPDAEVVDETTETGDTDSTK